MRNFFRLSLRRLLLPALLLTWICPANAQSLNWGGSLRGYQFFRVEELPSLLQLRRDTEFASARLTLGADLHPKLTWETHAVLDLLSPPASASASLARGKSASYFPLESQIVENSSLELIGRFDRFNLQFDTDAFRVVLGRQAISWGVSFFWPAMDLFSSFAPERIDRDYKEGVDAIRVTVPLGAFSELQVIGGSLGSSLSHDGAAAALARIYLGGLDLGVMGGTFHGDTVVGLFLVTGYRGTAYRVEATWTDSDDAFDRLLEREQFWRFSAGLDRQLSPEVSLTLEFAFNGFGVSEASRYALLAQSDRVRRGEMNALANYYSAAAVGWQLHPLWTISQSLLVNWQDPSALWIPAVEWSAGSNSSLQFGFQNGFGDGLTSGLLPGSEYGPIPWILFASATWYF